MLAHRVRLRTVSCLGIRAGIGRPFRRAGRLPAPQVVALSRRDASSRVTHGQAITRETAVKALAALLAILMGPLGTAQATAASPNAGVATGVITPPMPLALTQALTSTDRFNPSSRFILEPTEAASQSVSDFLTKLVGIDGVRIVADNRHWPRPESRVVRR